LEKLFREAKVDENVGSQRKRPLEPRPRKQRHDVLRTSVQQRPKSQSPRKPLAKGKVLPLFPSQNF